MGFTTLGKGQSEVNKTQMKYTQPSKPSGDEQFDNCSKTLSTPYCDQAELQFQMDDV